MAGNMIRDKKTGRMRRKDMDRSRTSKRAAAKRRGRKTTGASKLAISRGVRRALRTGRTASGRRTLKRK